MSAQVILAEPSVCCAAPGPKDELFGMFQARGIIQFAEFYPAGHKQSNYRRWFHSSNPYPIRYKTGYEPYILVSRRYMPWYDERFRGYGWDKVLCPPLPD